MRPLAEELRVTAAARTELATTTTARSCTRWPSASRPSWRHATAGRRTAVLRDVVTVVIALGSIGLGVLVGAAADGLGTRGRDRRDDRRVGRDRAHQRRARAQPRALGRTDHRIDQ